MAHPKNPKRFIVTQSVVVAISVFLTVATIIDLASGQSSTSLWIAVVCWPLVAAMSLTQIVQVRREL